MTAHGGVDPERVQVVSLGVDHSLFRPEPQAAAREAIGIAPEKLVLLYVGSFDRYHDLAPLIRALPEVGRTRAELHLVGDDIVGETRRRAAYEELARSLVVPVVFHGKHLHGRIPQFIAAADLCVAPYNLAAFADGILTSATLKVPEYMACGRPVAAVSSGRMNRLIEPGVSGFLLPNDVEHWVDLLRSLPARERLMQMGRAAVRAVEHLSWESTAAGYWEVCRELMASGADVRARLPATPPREVRS